MLKIINKTKTNKKQFSELVPGELFIKNNKIYQKVHDIMIHTINYNAHNFETFIINSFKEDELVTPVKGELTINES